MQQSLGSLFFEMIHTIKYDAQTAAIEKKCKKIKKNTILFSNPEPPKKQQTTSKNENEKKKNILNNIAKKHEVRFEIKVSKFARQNVQHHFKINTEFLFEFPAEL